MTRTVRGSGTLVLAALVGLAVLVDARQGPDLLGFTAGGADRQRAAERLMAAIPDAGRMREHHRVLTRHPHHAASAKNLEYAEYIRDQLASFGYRTEMMKYDVLLPWGGENRITLTAPVHEELSVTEPPIPEDPETFVQGALPPMAAYVAEGEVSGELVYANYGRIEDYRWLDAQGISLDGRIVVARYGGRPDQMRGMKVREAARRGAVGAIIYSDPEDDGFVRGDVYPKGTWRPWTGVQYGSFLDVPIYPGDPLTPFEPSIPGTERIPFAEAETIQKIPAHPISYGEALKLLRHLGGPVVPGDWQGGLPLTYHIGPGPARVTLSVEQDYQEREIWNVFGTIEGGVEPDRVVLAGGHRDSWVLGARDPTSGAVSLLETARAIGEVVRQGFTPRRSIRFASWGGEEFFLLGSTEYGEQYAASLRAHLVAYLNRETYLAGPWTAAGAASLERLMIEAARDAPHPVETSLLAAWQAQQPDEPVGLEPLGSGSDYAVFAHHLGVPSLEFRYISPQGINHSRYDTFNWFQRFGDPDYRYGVALADMVGRLMLRLANAEVLPFDFTGTGEAIGAYVDELRALEVPEGFGDELAAIAAGAARLRLEAISANRAVAGLLKQLGRGAQGGERLADLNGLLMAVERDLTDDRGLPKRAWYRALVDAPGYYAGYAAKTLPGVREAMEEGEWEEASEQASRLSAALTRAADRVAAAGSLAREMADAGAVGPP